jgi:hypothetical protein
MTDLKRLALEMAPVFSSLSIHREAMAALAYFKQAVESESVSLTLINGVATFLRRSANDPVLEFQKPRE